MNRGHEKPLWNRVHVSIVSNPSASVSPAQVFGYLLRSLILCFLKVPPPIEQSVMLSTCIVIIFHSSVDEFA